MSNQTLEDIGEKERPTKFEEIVSTIEQLQVLDELDPETSTQIQTNPMTKVIYQIIYPEELNLIPINEVAKKRGVGRPKKIKTNQEPPPLKKIDLAKPQNNKIKVVSKTRSGREVKFPKYIENDFKSIEINPADTNVDSEVVTTDFVKYLENDEDKPSIKDDDAPKLELIEKKRKIAAQYRCPKCKKAYLGKNKILKHLKKNHSHGPMHQTEENHFEVWNYLVSITQKCPSSERGQKFCQELSNLLHNLQLLTNALFKKLGSAANEVKVDKVLGNAIGLNPGTYYFDDNNLYKDVTVLQLMGNTDFLNSIRSKTEDLKGNEKNCHCSKIDKGGIDELVLKSMQISEEKNALFSPITISDYEMKNNPPEVKNNKFEFSLNNYMNTEPKPPARPKSPKIKIQSNILICPANPKYLQAKPPALPKKTTINPEVILTNNDNTTTLPKSEVILTDDNSVLMATLPHSVDELMLPVSAEPVGHILDNSSSSDEVMNVDQFVNERFRRITESDLEVTNNSSSLNLDLPALDLFQFHNT